MCVVIFYKQANKMGNLKIKYIYIVCNLPNGVYFGRINNVAEVQYSWCIEERVGFVII